MMDLAANATPKPSNDHGNFGAACFDELTGPGADNLTFIRMTARTEKLLQAPNKKHLFQGSQSAHILLQ